MLRSGARGLLRQGFARGALSANSIAPFSSVSTLRLSGVLDYNPASRTPQDPFRFASGGFALSGVRHMSAVPADSNAKDAARSAIMQHLASSSGEPIVTDELFTTLCTNAGIPPDSIRQLVRELEDEGLLLQHEERVYLRSPTVAKAVAEAVEETSKAPPNLEKIIPEEVRQAADRRATLASWGVLGAMSAHFAAFFWGTYIEYSWDVTEPLAFFSQLVVQILTFVYFMYTANDFSNSTLRQRAYQKHLRRLMRRGAV